MIMRITSKKQIEEKTDLKNLKTEIVELKNSTLNKIKQKFEDKNIISIYMTVNNNDLQIEFGEGFCFIEMMNEEKAEIYVFVNPEGKRDEFMDLYANSYKKSTLCYNINDVIEIIKAFSVNGEPNSQYQWEVMPM